MQAMSKNMIFGAIGAGALVALLAILDLALKFPFGGYSKTTDILFLVSAAIVIYLGWESLRES
jgi:hypothetical protein